jgi:hypothetical protein
MRALDVIVQTAGFLCFMAIVAAVVLVIGG